LKLFFIWQLAGNTPPINLISKSIYLLKDLDRSAAIFKLPMTFPSFHPVDTMKTMRVLTYLKAKHPSRLEPCTHHLFHSYFAKEEDAGQDHVILAALVKSGFSEAEGKHILEVEINLKSIKDTLKKVVEKSVADGAFGGTR